MKVVTRREFVRRSGITLTEILISIFIMGIGMLSLATLFPMGLMRLRDAARSSRSALLAETAASEIASRDLLNKQSFFVTGYPFDPFTADPAGAADLPIVNGLNRVFTGGAGLPVCYDPLWWYQAYTTSGGAVAPSLAPGSDFRFASGLGAIRADPDGGPASAYGLQRITNFPLPPFGGPIDPGPLFASQDDVVMQTDGSAANPGSGSPISPDLSTASLMRDYTYTWMFTGKQTDVTNGTIFDGDVVIFHNRPFATEVRAGQAAAAGEVVVEAIWGYGQAGALSTPYSLNDRTVLLRWPKSQADPDVRVGGFIADVTYERFNATESSRWYNPANGWSANYPAQRCIWYRVAKKTDPTADHDANLSGSYREMIVTVSSPIRAKTPLDVSQTTTITALHVNAAFVSPYVVNVISRVFYTR